MTKKWTEKLMSRMVITSALPGFSLTAYRLFLVITPPPPSTRHSTICSDIMQLSFFNLYYDVMKFVDLLKTFTMHFSSVCSLFTLVVTNPPLWSSAICELVILICLYLTQIFLPTFHFSNSLANHFLHQTPHPVHQAWPTTRLTMTLNRNWNTSAKSSPYQTILYLAELQS